MCNFMSVNTCIICVYVSDARYLLNDDGSDFKTMCMYVLRYILHNEICKYEFYITTQSFNVIFQHVLSHKDIRDDVLFKPYIASNISI